jgi:hypothetical protein
LTIATPAIVTTNSIAVGGTCNSNKYTEVQVLLLQNGQMIRSQNVDCVNNVWNVLFTQLTSNTIYTINANTESAINNCTGEDDDTITVATLQTPVIPPVLPPVTPPPVQPPVCSITELDLTLNVASFTTGSVSLTGTCNSNKYTTVALSLQTINGTIVQSASVSCIGMSWSHSFV